MEIPDALWLVALMIVAIAIGKAGRRSTKEPQHHDSVSQNELTLLEEIFRRMREEAGWETSEDLLWGYFFFHKNRAPLARLAERLVELDYAIVEIELRDDGTLYRLHVERIETHSPDSLQRRNRELDDLAKSYGIQYDGWDVGPVKSLPVN